MKADEIKLRILDYLNKENKWHSYYDVQKGLSINYDSLKLHMKFLEKIGLVELQVIKPEESKSGKGSYDVRITDKGREVVKKW